MNVVGDIHGQFSDLLRMFEMGGFPEDTNYLFLGDYVDRANQGVEVLVMLMCYKVKHPEVRAATRPLTHTQAHPPAPSLPCSASPPQPLSRGRFAFAPTHMLCWQTFFLLRGNHECASLTRIYGFYDECRKRYSVKLWREFTELFNSLPLAALIDNKIFCVHGGISPEMEDLGDILNIQRPQHVPEEVRTGLATPRLRLVCFVSLHPLRSVCSHQSVYVPPPPRAQVPHACLAQDTLQPSEP